MRYRNILLAAMIAALPLAARAQPVTGLYIGTGLGLNLMQNETDKSSNGVLTPGKSLSMGLGAAGIGSIGWGYGNGLRAEVEFAYRYNGVVGAVYPLPTGHIASSGAENKYGPMVNGFYDFNMIGPSLVPYIGVGAGYQWVSASEGNLGVHLATGTAGAFAYQAMLGAAMPIANVPGLSLTAEYRFMGLSGDRSYSGGPLHDTIVRTDNFNHSILIGLRYSFNAAPPPVAAAPTPVADLGAKTFLVFFDWDKADLTSRGAAIVHDAAAYSTSTRYTRIDVDGNTDTSGTPQYNMGLSERRARVVAAELVRDGVPQNAISMHAEGDTKLLVPTGPGVREPQNRRVEIVFH
jgi:outer membrane protein OmpA-like peptidoglycan-associated protein